MGVIKQMMLEEMDNEENEDDPEFEAIKEEDSEWEDHKDDEPEFIEPDPDDGPTEQQIEEMEIEKQIEQQEMIDRREI